MALFAKKVKIYTAKGNKAEWKMLREKLKESGIRAYASVYDDEVPVCCCGAGMDVRDFGAGGRIDRSVYQISVLEDDREKAEETVRALLPDYKPYDKDQART